MCEMKKVTKAQWARAKRMGYAAWRNGRPFMLYFESGSGTVWAQVEIVTNVSRDKTKGFT